ncbi:hypothetical protein BKA62DRAFT_825942 [Auriculariales sp. MPI-PUGE-AT-0066]|nr:hypothetical protein BKA62DRAFT_825942 [Auriculariales sp. MPI-PUGE-AT-0066]
MMHTSTPIRPSGSSGPVDMSFSADASLILPTMAHLAGVTDQPHPSRLFDLPVLVQEEGLTSEQIISALRSALEAHRDMAVQFDIDLEARDEMVDLLKTHVARYREDRNKWKHEADRRHSAAQHFRNKVTDLEDLCRTFEEHIERNREESLERSITDAASNSALAHLHQTLQELESERAILDSQVRDAEIRLAREVERAGALERENEDLHNTEKSVRKELTQARDAEVQLDRRVRELETELGKGSFDAELPNNAANRINLLSQQIEYLRNQSDGFKTELEKKEASLATLQEELEAQWCNTEEMNDTILALRSENHNLQDTVRNLRDQRAQLEEDNARLEARLQEEEEHSHLLMVSHSERNQIRPQEYGGTEYNLERRTAELRELDGQRQKAVATIAALEEAMNDRDAQVEDLLANIHSLEEESDRLRSRLDSTMAQHKRGSGDAENAQLAMQEAQDQLELSQRHLDDANRQLKERNTQLEAFRPEMTKLKDRITALNRQVEDLKHKNSSAERIIMNTRKERDDLEETAASLNVALEAKQHELEYMKRSLGVRGIGGTTPAPSTEKRAGVRTSIKGRRESSLWTPLNNRPGSSANALGSLRTGTIERRVSVTSTASQDSVPRPPSSASESGSVASSTRRLSRVGVSGETATKRPSILLGLSDRTNVPAPTAAPDTTKRSRVLNLDVSHAVSGPISSLRSPPSAKVSIMRHSLNGSRIPTSPTLAAKRAPAFHALSSVADRSLNATPKASDKENNRPAALLAV